MIIYIHKCESGEFQSNIRHAIGEESATVGKILNVYASYTLNLTFEQRKGIDFIGNRYNNGDDLKKILRKCDVVEKDDDWEWNDKVDYTFIVREHLAWEIKDLLESDDVFCPCFSPKFKSKLQNFIDEII